MSRRVTHLAPALVLALLTWSGFATPAQAQTEYESQVRFQLDLVKTFAQSVGWQQTHNYRIEALEDDADDYYTAEMDAGWEYRIVAFCDNDCTDIDLYLEDENGNEIDSDVSTNDVPIIECRPSWTGQFQIRVRMYECEVEPCYFGVGVFGRRQ